MEQFFKMTADQEGRSPRLIIGVAGGTGSGKTTVSRHIVQNIGAEQVALLEHDAYYKDQSHLEPAARALVNYDHPDSLDNDLLLQHLQALANGQAIDAPIYDFKTHTRSLQKVRLEPRPVIMVEGILTFVDSRIRNMMSLKIFVDTDADLRFIRRMHRDVEERGRSVDSIVEQYLSTVRLMHLEFVEPTKRYADIILPEGGYEIPSLLAKVYQLIRLMKG